ncbi:hypothetical protein Tco_1314252 [Tanacetum coccineum]
MLYQRKRLGQKGFHPSHSTIPIEDGDPKAEHKMCIKYASDADSASDDDTPVNCICCDWKYAYGVRLDQCHLQERQLAQVLHNPSLDADFLVADSTFMTVAFGVKMIAIPSSGVLNKRSI